jgi:Lar family restriction alleviation protein
MTPHNPPHPGKILNSNNIITCDADIRNAGYKSTELKPCPFCGSDKILSVGTKNEVTGYIVYKIFCEGKDCSASMHACLGGDDTKEESRKTVVERWNKRI